MVITWGLGAWQKGNLMGPSTLSRHHGIAPVDASPGVISSAGTPKKKLEIIILVREKLHSLDFSGKKEDLKASTCHPSGRLGYS